ncbi:endonuclease/exonuclease/phosphatase family protein [Sunxiuqinia sp. A32]|uniref:endonuclease/exonuclease/phosphatase family protein n=1 Tax=Sunxiuqinia sp. A32 TaxID=3461496 RepID=UPI0040453AE4
MRNLSNWGFLFLLWILIAYGCKDETPTQLKIAAYNVEYSKNASAAEIGEALKPFNFDVVCFSEAPGGDWTKKVGEAMGLSYSVVGKYSTAGHVDKYKTILSRTQLYGLEEVLMADTLHSVTKAKTKINNAEFGIYAVHFPFGWRDQAHIDETTNKISTFIEYVEKSQPDEISVIAGDFNFIPSNADTANLYHEMFKEIGMDVSWTELGVDCTKRNTYDALNPADQGSGEVIDHVIYNTTKLRALDGEIIEMNKPLSDHKPVWTLLEVK